MPDNTQGWVIESHEKRYDEDGHEHAEWARVYETWWLEDEVAEWVETGYDKERASLPRMTPRPVADCLALLVENRQPWERWDYRLINHTTGDVLYGFMLGAE